MIDETLCACLAASSLERPNRAFKIYNQQQQRRSYRSKVSIKPPPETPLIYSLWGKDGGG